MYEKTGRLPPAGSIREALFLTIWLRRQEMEVRRMAAFAFGVADMVEGKSTKRTAEAYKLFVDTAFPFAAKQRGNSDQKLVEEMKKEAQKGPIFFTPSESPNPLQKAARQMRLPDEFRKKLQQRARQKR